MALVYYASCIVHPLIGVLFGPYWEVQELIYWCCNIIGAIAILLMFVAYAGCTGGLCLPVAAALLGCAPLLVALYGVIQCDLVSRFLYQRDDFAWLMWELDTMVVLPRSWAIATFVLSAFSYYLLIAALMSRVPNRRAARASWVVACMVLVCAGDALIFPSHVIVPTVFDVIRFAINVTCFVVAIVATVAALRIVYRVVALRSSMYALDRAG